MIQINIPIQLIKIIKSFLENISFKVRVDNTLSSSHEISAGVPQGSCISPTLFTIYINDLSSSPGIKTNLFSDDTIFTYTSMSKFREANKITINPSKTAGILFGDK